MFGQQILVMIDEWSKQTGEPPDRPLQYALVALGERVEPYVPLEQVRVRLATRVNAQVAEELPGPTVVAGVLAMVELALFTDPEVSRVARKAWNALSGILAVRCQRLWKCQQEQHCPPEVEPPYRH